MTDTRATTGTAPRWVHWWAVLTAAVTLPLLLLGAEVTTKQVGMVDPDWPTTPLRLWFSSWQDYGLGYLIEHGHRLAGYTVGACVIVLVLALWLTERRRWLRWLGVAALAGVVIQGVLGGMRVKLNALYGPELALIHGCFGQMVFALLAALAVCTSRGWEKGTFIFSVRAPAETTRRWSLIVVGLLLLQLLAGAVLRHEGSTLAQRGHLLGAFAVVAAFVWLARSAWRAGSVSDRSEPASDSREPTSDRGLERALMLLGILIALQVLLGVEAWLTKFAAPAYAVVAPQPLGRDLVRSAHVLIGALVLAAAVAVALEAQRRAWAVGQVADLPAAVHRQVGNLPHETEAVAAARLEGAV
jgi:heme a synthase